MNVTYSVTGACLASLISAAVSIDKDTEGILFGVVGQRRTRHVDDEDEVNWRTETDVVLQSFVTTGPPLSFYSAAGVVDRARLASITAARPPGCVPVGWFKYRRGAPLRPSVRESAVQRELEAALREGGQGQRPASGSRKSPRTEAAEPPPVPAFLILGAATFKNQSVHAFDYRLFRRDPVFRTLSPVQISITSVVHPSSREQFVPATPLAGPSSSSAPSSNSLSALLGLDSLSTLGRPFPPHVAELEGAFASALAKLGELAGRVAAAEGGLEAARRKLARAQRRASKSRAEAEPP